MALIGKIRQNFWLVLIVLGLALASFVIMDILGSRSGGGLFNQTTVGEVNGNKIDVVEFQRIENSLFSGNQDIYSRKAQTWNYLVEKNIVDEAAEELGLGVSKDELMDLQFGANLSPVIQNNFRSQNGGVDRQQLLQIKQSIENGQELPPQFREFWSNQENQIIKTANQEKITNLVSKAMYTPSWLAEVVNGMNTERADFHFVKVGFDRVNDGEVQLSDDDYKSYLAENKSKFVNKEETRLMEYVVFDVLPTAKDSNTILESITAKITEFSNTTNDSLFAFNNGGGYSSVYSKVDDFTGYLKDNIGGTSKGTILGPYIENGYYQLAKVVDVAVIPDSVEARHILRSVTNGNPTELAAANKYIDSIRTLIESNVASFDSMAIKNSQDPGSATKGGDLGTFAQGTMVPQFNNACFIGSRVGGMYKVETQFGVHLIEVRDIIYNDRSPKYKIAIIGNAIVPSEDTQNAINDKAADLMRNNRTLESLRKAVEGQAGISLTTSRALKQNDFQVGNLPSGEESRAMVKWAFKAAPGDVSPAIYTIQDKVNYFNSNFVVAALKSIQKPGPMTIEEAKATIKDQVLNYKKGQVLKGKITSTDLNSLASMYGTVVDTAIGVSFNSASLPNAGSEPKVVAKIFSAQPGTTVGPIVGNNGVYVAKVNSINPSVAAGNIPQLKNSLNMSARSQANFRLWEAIKQSMNVEDMRAKFF